MHIQCWELNLDVMNKSLHVSSLGLFIVEHLLRTCAKVQFFQIVGCKKRGDALVSLSASTNYLKYGKYT